ncbi:NADP-dependent malic enzyme [Candidatus Gracilibacteria bacterium]|nr:NADP-dependent malic enzyme [Candidatus Gracilibacteria bacterium]OIO76034.1 MAG: NAD-dependent malic enzyme [Candidatus Gracilibacteria bacterium CG1_02_38_174]PIQ41531.1 MAG: NAD-dependent malic enzyme [Candidatus Gracilibacteria bacterium CG12_big_fil_rev_8_21_14_0_65_38_15]PIZ01743.1 MAG: NAD-dependent malic enzyme [Candidatus Gracilibacteria bacterium CG_4_10_14_0_8_um_filter_38_28]
MSTSPKNYFEESLAFHLKHHGKLEMVSKISINTREDLSLAYTPGVAAPCLAIEKNPEDAYLYTLKSNTVAVISDGSAVLGLGNIGALAGLPVMEGKCVLFKEFAGVNAFPIILAIQDTEEIIRTIKNIAPTFGGINLEDFSAPRCFEIEERLKAELDIPVMHDDQHGTAIVALAGLINSLKITGKKKEDIKIVINGIGPAGTAILKLFRLYGVEDIVACDSKGILSDSRMDINGEKQKIVTITNPRNISRNLRDAIRGADVFVGVSAPNILGREDIRTMAPDAIIFAMANPIPEIMPDEARAGGARIIATGRSDFSNQLNNVLVFPGIFKGALQYRIRTITDEMKLAAAEALAAYVMSPTEEMIIPNPLDKNVVNVIAESIGKFR